MNTSNARSFHGRPRDLLGKAAWPAREDFRLPSQRPSRLLHRQLPSRAITSPEQKGLTPDNIKRSENAQEPGTLGESLQTDQYSWTKQWYPLAAVKDLDPSRPHAEMLLGEKLVIWRDADSQWRCFMDECPHRLVPLSEGRIDDDGSLMCGYHGWSFGGDGKAVKIPQLRATSKEREATTCSNARACATSRPTQVRQGLLYVWGESGPQAEADSANTDPPVSSFRDQHDNSGKMWSLTDQFIRDLPGSFEVWTENMQDQSHVAWAHHGVAGRRGGEKEGYFKMHKVESNPKDTSEKGSAFLAEFDWTARGESINSSILYFKPPCLTGFLGVGSGVVSLYIHTVPLSANSTRLIINNVAIFPLPKKAQFLRGIKFVADYFRAKDHMMFNAVCCGDIIFMSGQHRALGRTAKQKGNPDYFLPSEADKGIAAWLRWLKGVGKGGPVYAEPSHTGDPFWDDSGKLKRRQLLDSYTHHTQKCSACKKLLTQVRFLKKAAVAFLGLLFLTGTALLGRGIVPLSWPMAAIAAAGGLVAAAMKKLRVVESNLTFRDWVQADLHMGFKF